MGDLQDAHLARLARSLPDDVDVRLVVTDMDGTLLDGAGQLPARLPQVLARMRRHGVLLCPASGRQLANLHLTFSDLLAGAPVIAENGTVAEMPGGELYRHTMTREQAAAVVRTVRHLAGAGRDVGAVVATPERAWVERTDERFLEQVDTYYAARAVTGDLLTAPLDDVIKVAVHDFGHAETDSYPALAAGSPDLDAVVSGMHWTDLMAPGASKGRALAQLQERAGITPAQTVAFGDYLNDLELFDRAGISCAMANAHPQVLAAARFTVPANTDDGVLRTIELVLDRMERTERTDHPGDQPGAPARTA